MRTDQSKKDLDQTIANNQVIRLSGGDPVCYSSLSYNNIFYMVFVRFIPLFSPYFKE